MIWSKPRITGCVIVGLLASLAASSALAQERTPIEEFREGFPLDLSVRALDADLATILSGGDVSVYFARRAGEFLRTRVLPVRQPSKPLAVSEIYAIGEIVAEPLLGLGPMTLNAFITSPASYLEGIVIVHEGRIVFERYPRMRPENHHLTMSVAKVMASLVVDQLIAEGRIDPSEPISTYVPEFAGTPSGEVKVIDALDMTSGLQTDALTMDTGIDTDDLPISTRLLMALFGRPVNGEVEQMVEVMKAAQPDPNLQPGEAFQYSSHSTNLLVFLAEAVEDRRWADIFDERVWSRMHAEAPLQVHQSPDGNAGPQGFVSVTLRDLARFAMLYTPSWSAAAAEQVVSDDIVAAIRDGVRSHDFYVAGVGAEAAYTYFADDTMISNSRQWDVVWPDGDIWKGGLKGQGIYVSPDRDLVIAYFSLNNDEPIGPFLRAIGTSELFD